MILIFRQGGPGSDACHAIALFGAGLVGRAVIGALRRRGGATFVELPLDWNDAPRRAVDLTGLTNALLARRDTARIQALDIVWAAGKAGFGAGPDELAREMESFRDILNWTESVSSLLPGARAGFHLLSSAGGLFEGQRFVHLASPPQPLRPYGAAKLEQEGLVGRLPAGMVTQIYRPSSIYGFSGHGGRSGLINTLILNAKRHSVSRIFGGLDTVRDYVLATDIATFIAARIIRPETQSQIYLLASGKPASVSEIVRVVSEVIGNPLYLKLDVQPSNASHITFRPSALPVGWRPTDLETGIRLVMRKLSGAFEAGARQSVPRNIAPPNGG